MVRLFAKGGKFQDMTQTSCQGLSLEQISGMQSLSAMPIVNNLNRTKL